MVLHFMRVPLALGAKTLAVFSLALSGAVISSAEELAALPYGLAAEAQLASRYADEIELLWSQRVKRGEFKGVGGVKLAYASAVVPDERAAVVIVTGRTENLLKYQEVVADFVSQKYSVYVYDHRGQGFSERLLPAEPEKGHVGDFDDYVVDLQTFVQDVVKRDPHKRLFVLAHSMGGGVATRHLQRFPGVFDAAAMSSPMHQPNSTILISPDSSCWYFRLTGLIFGEAWAGGKARPYSHHPYDETTNEYTHSQVRWARVLQVENEFPKVRLGGPTRRWVAEACGASSALLSGASNVATPVLVLQAGMDTAVTPEGQDEFCAALAKTTGRPCDGGGPQRIEGARHELLIEADKYRVPAMTKILDFYSRQLTGA